MDTKPLNKETAQVFQNAIKDTHCTTIANLFTQLSASNRNIDPLTIAGLQTSGATVILSIHEENSVNHDPIGLAFLLIASAIGKKFGLVEDVIVDEHSRGLGLGSKLLDALIQEARNCRLEYLQLTSKPDRIEANALYVRKGFKLIAKALSETEGTNLYRLYF